MATDDDVVTIDQMADRADGGKRMRSEHDPAQRDAPEQPHGLLGRQLFEPPLFIRHRSPFPLHSGSWPKLDRHRIDLRTLQVDWPFEARD